MTREEALNLIAAKALMEVVAEEEMGVPESSLYMAMGMDYDKSVRLLSVLQQQKAIKVSRHLVKKGEEFEKVFKLLSDFENHLKELQARA